jgi:hypothetical protein
MAAKVPALSVTKKLLREKRRRKEVRNEGADTSKNEDTREKKRGRGSSNIQGSVGVSRIRSMKIGARQRGDTPHDDALALVGTLG